MKKFLQFSALLFSLMNLAGQAWSDTASESSLPLATDRERIRVAEIPYPDSPGKRLKVLRTDTDTPLRAGTAWIWTQEPQEQAESYYAELKKAGLNAVRIILFDVWVQEAGYKRYDWNDPVYRQAMLTHIERAVNACSANGLYAIINAHNKNPSPHPNYDEKLNGDLWSAVAPYFANRTHVAYELSNEPISGVGKNGVLDAEQSKTLASLGRVHGIARSLAPNTHLMILTPAGISGWGSITAMGNLTRNFEKLTGTLDWSKTSVAYHLYHADANLFPKAENLRAFHSEFPGWPSENNFPADFSPEKLGIKSGDSERSVSFGADHFIIQTCERLGLGWSQWQINGPEQFRHNWPLLWNDAKEHHYEWIPDRK